MSRRSRSTRVPIGDSRDHGRTASHIEFREDPSQVGCDGPCADSQLVGDFPVRGSAGDQAGDISFARA